jgi:hypothetical protein
MSDNDCEDQACKPTDVCLKYQCSSWDIDKKVGPSLVKRGKFWCCSKCGDSYGSKPHPHMT